MAEKIWLQVAMQHNITEAPVDLRFLVDVEWLRQHTQGDLDGESARVRLNATGRQIEEWRGHGRSGPSLTVFGGTVQLNTWMFPHSSWQGRIKLVVSGQGPIRKVILGEHADYRCELHSGAVTVWTRDGFGPGHEQAFFNWIAPSSLDFDRWCRQVWPDPNSHLAAIRFGAEEIQIDVQSASERTRSTLFVERPIERLWKLSDCDTHENLRTPRRIIDDLRKNIDDSLRAGKWCDIRDSQLSDMISTSERRSLVNQAPPEVYYRAPRATTPTPVLELLRPDFDIKFQNEGVVSRWSPLMAYVNETTVELHDSDHILAAIKIETVPMDPAPAVRLKWKGDGVSAPNLIDGQVPVAKCVGVSSGQVQNGYIWQYANTKDAPSTASNAPVLIRYAVPQGPRPADGGSLPTNVDGPIPIARSVVPDEWQLQLTPTVLENAPAYAKTVSLSVSTDAAHKVELELCLFSGMVRAESPALLSFTTRLADPASPPNVKLLSGTVQRGDPLTPTSLVFSSEVVFESKDPVAQIQLEVSGENPVFFVQASATGSVSGSVQLFWPHAPAALIDPVPAAARNLQQTRDLETLRTLVERDCSHGLSAWGVGKFRLLPDHRLLARAGGAEMAMLDGIVGLAALRPRLHSALAMLPWVACRDQPDGNPLRQLHHRNLVLEPGEFAAASQDRSIDGRPMAFANTERDFLEAVRDPFTLAVAELPNQPTAAEIVHWLPGASLATSPAAQTVRGSVSGDMRDRLPAVVLQDGISSATRQSLKVLYRDGTGTSSPEATDWLSYNLRRAGWDLGSTPPKPKVELAAAGSHTGRRWRLARNASVPLLFDDANVTFAHGASLPAMASAPPATWICHGDEQGRIVVADLARPTNRRFLRGGAQESRNAIRITVVAAIGANRWVVAVDGQGESFVWKSSGELADLALVDQALPNAGIATVATACQAEGIIALLTANPATGALKLLLWDPTIPNSAANPVVIGSLPQITPANIRAVSLAPDGAGIIIAVAHSASSAIVLRGSRDAAGWRFTPLVFGTPVTARLLSAAAIENKVMVVTVTGDTDCQVWSEKTGNDLTVVDSLALANAITAVAMGAWMAGPGMRPVPENLPVPEKNPKAMLCLASTTGQILSWHVRIDGAPGRQPDRALPGNNGPADGLLAVDLMTAALGERLPIVPRPHLLAFGAEGVCWVWDIDAQQPYRSFASHEDVYDNAGTLRTARPGTRLSPIAYTEWVNRPSSAGAKRSEAASNYALFNTIVEFSSVPVNPADALIRSTVDPEAVTEIYLMCDRLRLRRQDDRWIPESFEEDVDPGPDRPRLPFPFHRGLVGGYGMYSLIEGETEDLNYYPRLAGLPVFPTRLLYVKFAEANGSTDFNQLDEMEFEAALLNPLEVSCRELKVSETQTRIPPFVHQAINNQSVIRVRLKRNPADRMTVEAVSAVAEKLVWTVPPTVSPDVSAEENLDGRLAKLEGAVSYEPFVLPRTSGAVTVGRLVLRLTPAACQVELLGGLSPLDGGDFVLVGYGGRETPGGGRAFGFETPKLQALTASAGSLPLPLLRTPDRIALDSPLRAMAVDELSSSFSLVSAGADATLTWWDVRTAKPWSRSTLDGSPTDLGVGHLQTATILYSYGTRLQAIDAELHCDWLPGAAQNAGDVRTDWSAGEPITALAATGDRFFVGNAQGRLLGWDDFGQRKFAVDLFAGPILQLAAASTPSGPVVVALDSTQSIVSVVDGATGEVLLQRRGDEMFPDDSSPQTRIQLRQIAVREMGNDLVFAVLHERAARWWKINPDTWALLPLGKIPNADNPDAIAIGAEGASLALFYTADGKIRCMFEDDHNVTEIGDAPGPNASIDFGQDETKQLLAAVAPGAAIRLWERPFNATAWTVRDLTATPEDGGQRLAVFLERVGASWIVTAGPGERLEDPMIAAERVVQVFDATAGIELIKRTVPDAAPRAGLLGPRLATTSLPSSHAAVCQAASKDVSLVDLRSGLKRFLLSHNDVVRAARFGRFDDGTSVLLTTTQQAVFCWDNARREKLYNFDEAVDIEALAVDGAYAAVAAVKIRLWRFAQSPASTGAEAIQFGEANWVPRRVALRVAEDGILVAAAAQSLVDNSYRLEIWDLARPLGTPPRLRFSWAADGEIRDVAILDAATIAVSRRESGHAGVVEILNVPALDQAPVVRWRQQLTADTAVKLTTLKAPVGPRLVFDDNTSIGVWALAPRLHIANDGLIDHHLPVQLLNAAVAGDRTISADILPGGKAALYLASAAAPANLLRLHPASMYREAFGFIAGLATAGTDAGNLAVCLWRNVEGNISGSLVDETTQSRQVHLAAVNGANQQVAVAAAADFIQLRFTAFNPDASVASRLAVTTSARITATLPQGTLTLYVGEQQLEGDEAPPSEFFAHLSWKASDFELQGPVRVRASAEASNFAIVPGVYRLQPVQIMTASSTDRDIAMPLADGRLLVVDLAGGEERGQSAAGEGPEPFYASLRLSNAGLELRQVADVDIPFDLCLDSEAAGQLPSALPDVVQLVHRQVLGSRLRHQQLAQGGQLLTAASTEVPSAHTSTWALAPIVQDGDRYRMLVHRVFVKSAVPLVPPGCDLRLMVASEGNPEDEIIRQFQIEFDSKKMECAVLIVRAISHSEKWTLAGFDDAGEFRTVVIDDPNYELSKELKKEPRNEIRIVELATSSLGRPPPKELQTENLLLLSRDDTDSDELGAMVGLHNLTAETNERFLLNEGAIDERLEGIQATGAVVQRILRGGSPATLRVVPRNNAPTASGEGVSGIRSTLAASAPVDFRIVTPPEASRMHRRYEARYLLDEPPVDPVLDRDRLAWRRFGVADVQWPDRPSRNAATSQFGFLWSERTAFHRMPPPAAAPPSEQIFPVGANLAKSFRPRAIEIQLAPDKPGAMFHHAIQAIESAPATPAPTGTTLPRPPGLVTEPATDFALREPMQLTPPPGADLVIEKATHTPIVHRQAERIRVQWKETLGAIKVEVSQTTVPLRQLDVDVDCQNSWPKPKDVRVALDGEPFLQTIVRINDELLEIEALQPQFPLYDARQSAATSGELDDRTKAFREADVSGDRRPLAPQMEFAVDHVSFHASDEGLWALATAKSQMCIWRLDVEKPTSSRLPSDPKIYFKTTDDTPFLAEFATQLGRRVILCNDNGTQSGLFLRDVSETSDTSRELSNAPVHAIRFVAFASVAHPVDASDDDVYRQIGVEAYIVRGDNEVQVWYQRSDQTVLQGPFDVHDLSAQAEDQLDATSVVRTPPLDPDPAAPKLKHHVLSIAVGGGKGDRISTYEIDFSEAAHTPKKLGEFAVENLTALSVASMENTLVVLAGDAQGRIQCLDPMGHRLKQYVHPAALAVERITVGEAAGRLVVAVVVEKQESQARVSIWDALAETLLRTTGHDPSKLDDRDYGVVRAIQLSGGVQFLAAQTAAPGRVQLFDPLLTPFRPPELYFVSRVNHVTAPIPLEICYTKEDGNTHVKKIMEFKPYLIMTDRNDKAVEYQSLLASILTENDTNAVRILTLKHAKAIPNDANLRWERAGSIRIAWRSTEPLEPRTSPSDPDTTLEAVLHDPLGDKQVKPVPYSAVAPKIAAVALMDDTTGGPPCELWQKTAFFGDAATAGGGAPALRMSDSQFVYEAIDQEMFDVPVSQRSSTSKLNLMLIKYLVNGQVIGTGAEVIDET